MTDMDEFSVRIGRLLEASENLTTQMTLQVAESRRLNEVVGAVHTRLVGVEAEVDEMRPDVKHYAQMRQRAIGIGALFMAFTAGAGAFLDEAIAWLKS